MMSDRPSEQASTRSTKESVSIELIFRFSLSLLVTITFAAGAFVATDWRMTARVMPFTVSVAGFLFGLINLALDIRRLQKVRSGRVRPQNVETSDDTITPDGPAATDAGLAERAEIRKGLMYMSMVLGLIAAIYVFGAMLGAALFIAAFLRFKGQESWLFTAVGTAGVVLFIYVVETYMGLYMPENLLGL